MRRVSFLRKAMMFVLATILGFGPCISGLGTLKVQAKTTTGSASYATGTKDDKSEAVGTWSYWVDGVEIKNNNADLLNKLPYEGSAYRYTTDNYDQNYGAFDTSNWATSFMWDLDGDNPYSSTVYAIPLAFRASVHGGATNVIQVTAPSRLSDAVNNTYTMQMPPDGTLTDFMIHTSFDVASAKVDAVTDWTYDIVMENSADTSEYLKMTMVQGSVFAYFELVNDNSLTITRGRGLPAAVAYTNETGNVIVIRCMDNMNNDYDYYAFYGAAGTTFDVTTSGNMISSIDVEFTGDAYMSLAYLGSTPNSPDDSWGASMCQAYLPYAYNFVTDTTATYSYDPATSTVTTVYEYEVSKKVAGAPDGTIMGVLPHQYKNIKEGTQFLSHTYETIRGTMKTIAGSSFTTELKYSGIIPFMPNYSDDSTEEAVISAYLKDYTDDFSSDYFENYEGSGDTYWDGKGLNRLANAMAAAEAAGDVALAKEMYNSLKSRLEEWFTYSGASDSTYFYYDSGVGSMFGFPQSYDSVNQINDHHFHYGYFIYAAAQVVFRDLAGVYGTDGTWAQQYGGLVNELINDIACPTRNKSDSDYPYLRNFAPYEGHSWASGHANFDMGNNQESSSEALNAWAGIILWGEATGDTDIRDLGIYLYTTEISAVQNYWYDVDEDVLSDAYRYKVGANEIDTIDKSTAKVENNSAAIVWGGSYTYATWFSANPLYIQGINLLPMNPTCFYLAGDADYIQQNWDLAYKKASAAGWDMESWVDIWCQYYAMAFPEEALAQWKSVEEGTDSYGVEGGDTKAHTYHFIKSLCTYGTPDTSISSDATLSSVFVKDGVKTYVAYNATSVDKPITFSDGYQITVPANSMKVEKEGEAENLTKYTIQYYVENTNGEFVLDATQAKYGEVGTEVSVEPKEMAGYVYDTTKDNVTTAEVTSDGNAVLKLYYKRAEYTITYVLNGEDAVNDSTNPTTYKYKDSIQLLEPVNSYYKFVGWYKDKALTDEVTMIQDTMMGDITLYAAWQDPYEYALDATKVLTYEDGIITITISDVPSTGTVDLLWKICEESAVDSVVSGGASALTGMGTTYDETAGTWSVQLTESNGVTVGKYLVFMINTIRDGVGELSGVGVYEIPEVAPYTTVNYYENFYQENLDGSFSLYETVKKKGKIDSEVTCTENIYTGFVYDSANALNVQSGTLSEGTVTTLARYYVREEYDITYNLISDEEAAVANNPVTYTYGETVTLNNPSREGYTFVGWYTNADCTAAFTGIKATTTGDITLYAKWVVEGQEQATYTVEHYKQKEADSNEYTLDSEATETITGYVGTTVYATAKTYEGYTENATHGSRVNSGIITEDGSLTLKLYYDIVTTSDESDTFGVTYDASTGIATFYYNGVTGGTIYYAVYDDLTTAQGYADAANLEENYPGFGKVPGHAGCLMTSGTNGAQYQASIAAGKYIVYAFNPENKGVEDWYVAAASSIDVSKAASYTVEHYKQDAEGSENYTLAATETLQGEIGETVTATPKNYVGYTVYADHASYSNSGTVLADGSLKLAIYYNKTSTDDSSYDSPENGGFTYDASTGVATFYYEGVTNGIVYIATYGTQAEAEEIANAANGGGGFSAVTGHGGYMLTKDGDRATADYSVTEGKYMVYAFNPEFKGVEDWYVGYASANQSGGNEDDETTTAAYTVEHYKQDAVGSSDYTLAATENLEGTVGETVTATAKTYTGYTLNTGHEKYKASGTVLEDGSLVLTLYYDLESTESTERAGRGAVIENGTIIAWVDDAPEGTTSAKFIAQVYNSKEEAEARMEDASDAGVPSYAMDADGDGTYSRTISEITSLSDTQYLLYQFYLTPSGFTGWVLTTKAELEAAGGSGEEEQPTTAAYKVEHYTQDEEGSSDYTLAATENLEGTVGETVTATAKTYSGYTLNTGHEKYKASGTVLDDGSLVLALYYDLESTESTERAGRGAAIENGTIIAWVDDAPEGTTSAKFIAQVYNSKEEAEARMEDASDAGMPSYAMDADGDGTYSRTISEITSLSDTQYLLYQFYLTPSGFTGWVLTTKAELEAAGGSGEIVDPNPTPVEVTYTVKHYQQNASQNGYELKDTENLTGYAGDVVTATAKTYTGFTYKAGADGELLTGTLAEGATLELSLYYTRNTYGITYNNLENATNAAGNMATYVYGVGLTLEDPTYKDDSHTFAGWYEDAACTATPISVIAADRTGDVTVYAKWEEADNTVSYTVEYYQQNKTQNGYDLIHSDVLSGEAGDTVTATINTYTGFTQNAQADGSLTEGILSKDTALVLKVYYDRNTYNITYNNIENATNAAGNAATYVYGVGLTLQAPAYQDDSFTFGGWYEDAACTATPISAIAEDRTGDVAVYAKWIEADNSVSYTVEYYQQNKAQNGYDMVSSAILSGEAGDTVTATINTYTGFSHNEQAEGTILSGTLAKDVTLVLKVYYDRNTYNITYNNMDDATNAEANTATYVYGIGLTLQNPSREGYTFDGWFKEADFINPISVIDANCAADVAVYAKWTIIITEADYVVKHYIETTTPGSYVEVIADRVAGTDTIGNLIEAEEKKYEGYELNEEAEGSLLSGKLVANEVLTLKLFYDRCTYTITYNNMEDAANPEENAETYTYGEGFTLSEPVKENYVFAGWYLDEACTAENRVTKITDLQIGDVVLYAKWQKEYANYTIRFYQQNEELTGYDEVTADTIIASNEIGTVVDAIAYGYGKDYTGYVLNEEYAESVISGTVSKTEPLTLKLYYDRASYNITYANMEGATNAEGNQATYVYGIGLTLQAPAKEGWIFAGWYMDSAFTEDLKIAVIGITLAEDVTVYAKWIEESQAAAYTVYYYLQDVNLKAYTEVEADRFTGSSEVGVEALAPVKDYEGFELNIEADGYKASGKVLEDGSLELKLYYDRCNYNIIYHNMEDAVNPDTNTAVYVYGIGLALGNPSKGGYVFEGWYTNEGMSEEDKTVEITAEQTGDVNLYAKWAEYVPDEEVEIEPDQSFTVDEIQDQYYTGSKIVPSVVVKDGDVVLTEKKDYTLKFSNNVKAGTATVKITGKGNYSGYVEKTFTIKPVDIGTDEMTADDIFVAVNKSGKAITVKPKLVWGKMTLKMNTDYKIDTSVPGSAVSYSQPGTYTVTLQGIGNYEGSRTLEFTIANKEAVLMSKVKVGRIANQYYRNGAIIEPELKVSYKNEPLVEGVDYEAEYINNTQAGTATVILTGIGDTYVGETKVTFKIVGTALSKMGISLNQTEFEYTGESIYPEYFSGDLMAGKDFTVTYSNNKKVGKGTVTFTGIGAYSGTVKKTFKILPYNIENNTQDYFEDTTGEITLEYVKAGCTPKVEVRFKGTVLKEGTDYTLKYNKNKAVGTATVLVTGKGTYKGTYKKDFTITKGSLANVLIIPTDIVGKTGQKANYYMAKVTLTDASGKKLAAGTDYDKEMTFEYKNAKGDWITFDKNSNIGDLAKDTELRVTVKERADGKGNFTGSVTAEYKIIASTGNIKSAKVKINDQTYTGQAVELTAEDFQYVTVNGANLTYGTDYEIVEDSYVKNITKGTAKVTIRGIGENYGGTKVVSFKIGARSLKDIIAGIFKK